MEYLELHTGMVISPQLITVHRSSPSGEMDRDITYSLRMTWRLSILILRHALNGRISRRLVLYGTSSVELAHHLPN
jgi:hypothetical protein